MTHASATQPQADLVPSACNHKGYLFRTSDKRGNTHEFFVELKPNSPDRLIYKNGVDVYSGAGFNDGELSFKFERIMDVGVTIVFAGEIGEEGLKENGKAPKWFLMLTGEITPTTKKKSKKRDSAKESVE